MKKCNSSILIMAIITVLMWAAIAGAGEIVIGYSGPLSGPAADYGVDCSNGITMAIDEINAAGGITIKNRNYTFRLEKMDDSVNPARATSNAIQMRTEHKAMAIYNPVTSTTLALMKINEQKRNEFIIMTYTSMPGISEMGNKLMLTITPSFNIAAKAEADLAWGNGWRKVAMIVTAGPYGDMWRKVFKEEWIGKGGTITVNKSANYYTRTDFTAPLAEALATNPDFLLIGGPSSTTGLLIEQARDRGFEGGFVLIDQAKLEAIYSLMSKPLLMEGTIGYATVEKSNLYPASQTFFKRYTSIYKRALTWEAVTHYTSMYALAKAIIAAGTVDDVKAIRAAFPSVFPLLGDKYPLEVFGVTPGGRMINATVIQSVKYGKLTEPKVFIWWPKSQKEFNQIKKLSRITKPMIWKIMAD